MALAERLHTHVATRGQKHHRGAWLRSLHRRGLKPGIHLVQEVPHACWSDAETFWISFFRDRGCPLVNGNAGGHGGPGYRHTPESRAKMSAARRGVSTGPRGPMSEAQKSKLRASAHRQMEDPAMRAAISKVHSGKTLSAAHKAATGHAATKRWAHWREGRFPADLAQRYAAGEALHALAVECGVARPTMRRELLARGVVLRGRWGHPLT